MDGTLADLRVLAAGDPKAARQMVESLLEGDAQELEHLLTCLAAPDEGRLRQLVANTVRQRPDREKVLSHLLRWLEYESDEFSRAAIQAAVADIPATQRRHDRPPYQPSLVETYRYVAGRLCHKVRNALPGPMTHLRRIEDLARQAPDPVGPEILAAAGQLRDALRSISRLVEFDTGDRFFEWRLVHLTEWLEAAGREYNSRNEPIVLKIECNPGQPKAIIRANDFLLETIFWNLWNNARQAVEGACQVMMAISVDSGRVVILASDNGKGLPEELAGLAFEDQVSTHGDGRGRGLLEVAEAIQRLSGEAKVVDLGGRGHRVQLSFPQGIP